jgi:hypothetical protein
MQPYCMWTFSFEDERAEGTTVNISWTDHFVYSEKTFTDRWYALFMYMLQLCSIFCTSYNMRGSIVSDITHMRQCCKWLVKRLDENIRILQHFKIK